MQNLQTKKSEIGQQRGGTVVAGKIVGHYSFQKLIGKGAFSEVFYGIDNRTNSQVAIKMVSNARLNDRLRKALEQEIEVLKQLSDNQNIVTLYNVLRTENNTYLIFEYCAGGDLHRYLKQKGYRLNEEDAQNVINQLAKALYALKQIKIAHRDLKLSNILLTNNTNIKECKIKLADFGLAREYQSDKMIKTHCGTPINMAPQILRGYPYNDNADLWSLGTIIYELVNGKTPYTGRTQVELLQNIMKKPLHFLPFFQLSPLIQDLIQKLLRIQPQDRISWDDFFKHQFVATNPQIFRRQLQHQKQRHSNMLKEQKKKKIQEQEAKKQQQIRKLNNNQIDSEQQEQFKSRKVKRDTDKFIKAHPQTQTKLQGNNSNNFLKINEPPPNINNYNNKNQQASDSSTNIKYYDSQLDDNSDQITGYDQGDSSSFSSIRLYNRKKQRHYSEKKPIESPPLSSHKQTLPQISEGSKEDGTSSKGSCIESKLSKRQDYITEKIISTLEDALQRSLSVIQMYENQFCETHAYSEHRNSGKYIVYKCCYQLMNTLQSIFAGEGNLQEVLKGQDERSKSAQKRNLLRIFESDTDKQLEIDMKIILKLRLHQKYPKLDRQLKEAFMDLYEKVQEFRTDLFPIIERSYTNFRDRILDSQGNIIQHSNITKQRMKDVMKFVVKLCQDSEHQKYLQNWEQSVEKLKRSKIVLSFLKTDYYQRDAFQIELIKSSKTTKSYVSSSDRRNFEKEDEDDNISGDVARQNIRGKLYTEKDVRIIKCLEDLINMRMQEMQSECDKRLAQ